VHNSIRHHLEFHQEVVASKEDPLSLHLGDQRLSSGLLTIVDQTLSIMKYPSPTESFISGATLKRIKVREVEQDEFIFVEMASGAKQKVGGKVMSCTLNLGEFVTRANLYVTILGSYDVVIGMDWLELHEAILKCKTKWLSLVDDEGQVHVILGRN
jgi:hypothetical protein